MTSFHSCELSFIDSGSCSKHFSLCPPSLALAFFFFSPHSLPWGKHLYFYLHLQDENNVINSYMAVHCRTAARRLRLNFNFIVYFIETENKLISFTPNKNTSRSSSKQIVDRLIFIKILCIVCYALAFVFYFSRDVHCELSAALLLLIALLLSLSPSM